MEKKVFSIKIVGPAGTGIKSGGQLLSKTLISHGYHVHDYIEYPSLVRGGHNTYQVSFSIKKIAAPFYETDLLFSLQPNHWQQHKDEFKKNTLVFSDEKTSKNLKKGKFFNLPLTELTEKIGNPLVANTICLGVAAYLLKLDPKICKKTISTVFKNKSKDNIQAFNTGYHYAQKSYSKVSRLLNIDRINKSISKKNLELCDGNEAFGWGFLKGKGNFYAAYPMTPSTGTLHFLAKKQKEHKIIVRHPEDEIAVANMAAGAAFAGARAAVGTSGGGFALMNETISFCGVAEIGMVYYLVQRVGPATGMPTWTAQGDLLFYVFSGHGEFPKIVLAPGDQKESFEFGWKALNLAANLQTPIIVISDKYLAESNKSIPSLKTQKAKINQGKLIKKDVPKGFKRYDWKYRCGRSYRTIPGTLNGEFLANSYEHDQKGFSTESGQVAVKMSQKRMRKLKTSLRYAPKPALFGNKNPKKLIISWGSTKGAILEAMSLLNDKNLSFLQIRTVWPIHPEVKKITSQAEKTIVIENNQTSQLTTLLKTQFNFEPTKKLLKFDGRPFFPEEIYEQLKQF